MITENTLRVVRTALTNLRSREVPIAMIGECRSNGYDLVYGVVAIPGEGFAPFTMRMDRLDPNIWDADFSNGERQAAAAVLDILRAIKNRTLGSPHE